MQIPPHSISGYGRLSTRWPRGDQVTLIIDGFRTSNFRIPVAFLVDGRCNNIGYVEKLAHMFVNEPGVLSSDNPTHAPLDPNDSPVPGNRYLFKPRVDGDEFTWSEGPQSIAVRGRPAPIDEDSGSFVTGTQSVAQSGLRDALLVRDGQCVVSGALHPLCDAAHLVPKARPDVYSDILGDDFQLSCYETSMGILLSKTLHKLYDNYGMSFLCEGSTMIVHVFDGSDPLNRAYHGVVISREWFRVFGDDRNYPDARLCAWHYLQCVLKFVRGFSSGLNVDAR